MSHPTDLPDDGDFATLGAMRLLMDQHSTEPAIAAALLVQVADLLLVPEPRLPSSVHASRGPDLLP